MLTVKGGILGIIDKNANGVANISVGDSKTVGTGMFIGFGSITVKLTVEGTTESAQGFYFIIVSKLR